MILLLVAVCLVPTLKDSTCADRRNGISRIIQPPARCSKNFFVRFLFLCHDLRYGVSFFGAGWKACVDNKAATPTNLYFCSAAEAQKRKMMTVQLKS